MSDKFSSPNVTEYSDVSTPTLKVVHDVLIVTLLVTVMFAMGCSITWEQLWLHVRRPFGIIIGMCSQFLLLPLSAFCLIKVLRLNILHGTGLLLLACSPGGVTSNIFTYFCDGDIPLSIAMTTCSTFAALGMMPLNLYIYGRTIVSNGVIIPYGKMSLSLVSVTCPVLVGMLLHYFLPRASKYITKAGSIAGFAIIIICQTMEFFIFPDIFVDVPWQLYLAVILLPVFGFGLGYSAAFIFRLTPPVRRSISIESGVQNVGTALTIVSLSFSFEAQSKVLLFPWLYAFSMTAVCVLISASYQLYMHKCSRSKSLDIIPGQKSIREVRYPAEEEHGLENCAYEEERNIPNFSETRTLKM